jgi:CRP-like cAMP-binding protein
MAKQADPAAEMLGSIDIFCGLDESHLSMIRQAARDHTFMAGQAVVEEGGADKRMYVILSGDADVLIAGDTVAHLRPGDYFGEIAVFDGGDRTASVVATTDVTAISVNSINLRSLIRENPQMGLNLIEGLCNRVRKLGSSPTN